MQFYSVGNCPRSNQGKSSNKVIFKINFKVFAENVTKAEGLSPMKVFMKKTTRNEGGKSILFFCIEH